MLTKISIFLTSLALSIATVVYNPSPAYAQDCFAKHCTIAGQACICCLMAGSGILCAPCGAYDCSGSDPGKN